MDVNRLTMGGWSLKLCAWRLYNNNNKKHLNKSGVKVTEKHME